MTANPLRLERSHGKPRVTVRPDEVPALPVADAAPMSDPKTGRFLPGNRAHRRRQLKERAEGVATMSPAHVPSWMRPHVELGAPYAVQLLSLLAEQHALHPLAGHVADAWVLARAFIALGLSEENPKERLLLMSEGRAWMREHRTSLATLAALAKTTASSLAPAVEGGSPWIVPTTDDDDKAPADVANEGDTQ